MFWGDFERGIAEIEALTEGIVDKAGLEWLKGELESVLVAAQARGVSIGAGLALLSGLRNRGKERVSTLRWLVEMGVLKGTDVPRMGEWAMEHLDRGELTGDQLWLLRRASTESENFVAPRVAEKQRQPVPEARANYREPFRRRLPHACVRVYYAIVRKVAPSQRLPR